MSRSIKQYGGALLSDPVGTGKTFTALFVAGTYSRTVVVGPAVLRQMWVDAARRASVDVRFLSHESLSRGMPAVEPFDFLIVDEAHHARNPSTRRFRSLASLARGVDVLLLSATPVHNRPKDLISLLSLFLGEAAAELSSADRARVFVRREECVAGPAAGMPIVQPLEWLRVDCDDGIAEQILALPPPLPLREGGVGAGLIIDSLIRQWASSDAALRGGLLRRRRRAAALLSALEGGTYPSQAELAAWAGAEDSVQLAFPELVATRSGNTSELIEVVHSHRNALDGIFGTLPVPGPRDIQRAQIIGELRRKHREVPIVVFSRYEDTVSAMFRLLSHGGEVAALSGGGGRVAGGNISRRDVIGRFAPRSNGRRIPNRASAVSLLLATDLLSEGVNMQDAAVVIHLDLPFTPARLDQRVGRVARLGSCHTDVWQYAFRPPATAETIARMEQILAVKRSYSGYVNHDPQATEILHDRLRHWSEVGSPARGAAAVTAGTSGFLALLECGNERKLVCAFEDRLVCEDPRALSRAAQLAEGHDAAPDRKAVESATARIRDYVAADRALSGVRAPSALPQLRRALLARIAAVVRHARPHERARIAVHAERVRRGVLARSGAECERLLRSVIASDLSGDRLLAAIADCSNDESRQESSSAWHVVAMILFARGAQTNALSPATER